MSWITGPYRRTRPSTWVILVLLAVLVVAMTSTVWGQGVRGGSFDHLTTGYPLVGAHAKVRCETCHQQGVLRGTPTTCAGCHTPGSRIAASAKPAAHVATAEACDACHRTSGWKPATMSHSTVIPGYLRHLS